MMFSKRLKIWRKAYDESLLKVNIQSGLQNMTYISEGMHYRVYKWHNNGVAFAVFNAKDRFYDDIELNDWIDCLNMLRTLDHPWIPIMEHFSIGAETYIVQPFLETSISSIENYELKDEKHSFKMYLSENNLELNDILQFRSSSVWGIQVHDWSDLKRIGG